MMDISEYLITHTATVNFFLMSFDLCKLITSVDIEHFWKRNTRQNHFVGETTSSLHIHINPDHLLVVYIVGVACLIHKFLELLLLFYWYPHHFYALSSRICMQTKIVCRWLTLQMTSFYCLHLNLMESPQSLIRGRLPPATMRITL